MPSFEPQTNGAGAPPKMTLFTNHRCPFAHRAHIALNELGLPYEEVFIDLETPREPWYLEVNPRGLVPSIRFESGALKDEILTESAVITQFLADSYHSHLLPDAHSSPEATLFRARVNFFVDTWNTKVTQNYAILFANTPEEKEEKSQELVKTIEKEIEPLLANADPFFNGSKKLTLAEVQVAPFLIRMYALCNGELFPLSMKESLDKLPNFSKWAKAVIAEKSVTYIWNEEEIVQNTARRIAKMKAEKTK